MHTVPLEQEFTLDEPGVGKDEADADCGSRLRRLEHDNALYDLEAESDGAALASGERRPWRRLRARAARSSTQSGC